MSTQDHGSARVTVIEMPSGRAAGYRIPPPPVGHRMHGKPRAGFVGDYRPLSERLADPATPKDNEVAS